MFVGIDIGGTFCDCVAIGGGMPLPPIKVPTNHDNLLETLTQALVQLLVQVDPREIERVTLSTTLITNQILEAKLELAALIAIPGPGLNLRDLIPNQIKTFGLKGSIDHQGKVTQAIDQSELKEVAEQLSAQECYRVAVVSKFGNRNAALEHQVKEYLLRYHPDFKVTLGSELSGRLNFPRRCQGAYLTAATASKFELFLAQVSSVMAQLGIQAPIFIMKADGGSLPIGQIRTLPLETIFSGPAASAIGAASIILPESVGIVADVGGTTTDLAIILDSQPLISSEGASIGAYRTLTRSFAVTSIALGGDSVVRVVEGQIVLGPDRQGPAACFGGSVATTTDIFNYLNLLLVGDTSLSRKAVEILAQTNGLEPKELSSLAVTYFINTLQEAIQCMLTRWETEPVYHIWKLLSKNNSHPTNIVAIGGAGQLIKAIAASLTGFTVQSHHFGSVANAIGAALTNPIAKLTFRADTSNGALQVEETGALSKLNSKDIEAVVRKQTAEYAQTIGLKDTKPYIVDHESFNQIRSGRRIGEIHYLTVQTPWELTPLKGDD